MKIARPLVKKPRIEIIPMIDVIFFLLVFFMISSLAHQKFNAMPVSLPKTSSQPDSNSQKIILSIESDGHLYLNKVPITMDGLAESLAHEMGNQPDETVIINADQAANYGVVMDAMEQAKKIGVRKFALLSKANGSKP